MAITLASCTIPIVKTVKAIIPMMALPQSTKLKRRVAPAKAISARPKEAMPPMPSMRPLKKPEIPFPFLSLSPFPSIVFTKTAPRVANSNGRDFKSSLLAEAVTLPRFFLESFLSTESTSSRALIPSRDSLIDSERLFASLSDSDFSSIPPTSLLMAS